MLQKLSIPDEILIQLEMTVQAAFPNEACGLLGGRDDKTEIFLPIANELNSPVAFSMAPEEQLQAFLFLEKEQLDLLAIFHSHPNGPTCPSKSDIEQFYYPGTLYVIWSPSKGNNHLHAYQISCNNVKEVPIIFEKSRNG